MARTVSLTGPYAKLKLQAQTPSRWQTRCLTVLPYKTPAHPALIVIDSASTAACVRLYPSFFIPHLHFICVRNAQPTRKEGRSNVLFRAGVGILAWLYFLGGVAAVVLAVMILKQDTSDMETAIKALIIALGGLSLALDIAVIALFFSKKLDTLIVECTSLAEKRRPKGSEIENCNRGRNRLSLYYTLSGVVRNVISYCKSGRAGFSLFIVLIKCAARIDFTRRVSSFTRHCTERVASHSLTAPTQMATLSGNGPTQLNSLNIQGGHQASVDSLRGEKAV
ncbi:hypothetical protein AG1IA_02430 [Rhizoctonia solani AG-1 IA]|uniref:Uncharacterized protein n=1 Tax=Thanatephorus cucumeris (strain AG1-IA) TaxID=983506 RepID=L8WZL6_THACA|nr:hypothetical protein AG1IA_02430 [Rhizoctonia solani AG-1 IA]